MKTTRVVVVTGMSGSGKSIAIRALEDLGYFCIDNLPVGLVEKMIDLVGQTKPGLNKYFALGMDLRDPTFVNQAQGLFRSLREMGYRLDIVYLDASDEILQRRFSETRRMHPQAGDNLSLLEAIGEERRTLGEMKTAADLVIETSNLTPHQLRSMVQDRFAVDAAHKTLIIRLVSFGFKYGLPRDADVALDVRFLPNPYFVETLRPFTGLDPNVAAYVLNNEETKLFVDKCIDLLSFLLPLYRREGKSYLTIAIGCTGGRHRSVAITEEAARLLRNAGVEVAVQHRDHKKENG